MSECVCTYIYYHQPLSVHCRLLLDISCLPCFLSFFSILLLQTWQSHFTSDIGPFLGLYLFLNILYRILVFHLSLLFLAGYPIQFSLYFFIVQMISVILVPSLIHLFHFLSLWMNPRMHLSMLLWIVWNFLKVLLVNAQGYES